MKKRSLKKTEDIRNQVSAIRILLNQEMWLPPSRQFQDADYAEDIKHLVIFMDNHLRSMNIDTKAIRDIRLKMLSTITQRKIKTTYDLTKYEAGVIFKELRRNTEESAGSLFEYFAKGTEVSPNVREIKPTNNE